MGYWEDRRAKEIDAITTRNINELEKKLMKEYERSAERIVAQFDAVYNKLISTIDEGKEPTPADLFKLDKYAKLQTQLNEELQKLGMKTIKAMERNLTTEYDEVYDSIKLESAPAFSTLNKEGAKAAINTIWCADGKQWSQRVWDNLGYLSQTLKDELTHSITTGKNSKDLVKLLMDRFNVSYSEASRITRTEMAHIQTVSAQQKYKDSGIKQVQIWASKDERRCDYCGKLHKKIYPIGAVVPVPAHPNCRCCVIPVVEED